MKALSPVVTCQPDSFKRIVSTMKIFQLKPSLVVASEGKVYKLFPKEADSYAEESVLNRAKTSKLASLDSGEVLKLVSLTRREGGVLILEHAKGITLTKYKAQKGKYVDLIADLLAKRHTDIIRSNGCRVGELLGDFIVDHLYYDIDLATVTYIDPGNNFLAVGDLGDDCARYIHSIFFSQRLSPISAVLLSRRFIQRYLSRSTMLKSELNLAIETRYSTALIKFRNLKSPVKAIFSSFQLLIIRILIKFVMGSIR